VEASQPACTTNRIAIAIRIEEIVTVDSDHSFNTNELHVYWAISTDVSLLVSSLNLIKQIYYWIYENVTQFHKITSIKSEQPDP
jgi:hypothetical protein